MIDVLDPGIGSAHQGDRVVNGIDTHQRNIANAVADARVANLSPEFLVADRIGGIEADMAEASNTGIAASKVASTTALRPQHQFDVVAGRITKTDGDGR